MNKSSTIQNKTSKNPKGVLMLVDQFLPLPTDGAERQAGHLAIYMARRDIWAGILTRRVGSLPKFEQMDGIDVIRVPQVESGILRSITFTLGAIFAIFARRHSFDILHAHLAFGPAVAATIAGKLLGKKVIVKFGNSGTYGDVETAKRNWRGRLAMAIILRWADIYIALSDEMEKEMLDAGFSRSKVIRMVNGVDVVRFCPPADKKKRKDALRMAGKIVVLYTGRLTSQKSLKTLLFAFQHSASAVSDLHLFLVGDGEDRSMLEAQSVELGIQNKITFVRWAEDISLYLQSADIFVLPSVSEGISNSLLEAMSAGLPCIATRVGGSTETLGYENKYGVLIDPGNPDQLAEVIIRLASNPHEAALFGTRARQRILEHYDLSIIGSSYHKLYEQMTA